MSYKNNWLKSLSESYNTNNRGQVNLSEELASQVALNEQLVDLVKALCEELGVDPQDLLEDVFTPEGLAASNASVNRLANKATISPTGKNMRRWSIADERAEKREKAPTLYTAKGGRVVIKGKKK